LLHDQELTFVTVVTEGVAKFSIMREVRAYDPLLIQLLLIKHFVSCFDFRLFRSNTSNSEWILFKPKYAPAFTSKIKL
jgi:hypothetical protein